MKLVLSTFLLVLTIAAVNCAKYDIEFASVLKKLKAFDLTSSTEEALETIPSDAFVWLTYIDYDCVEEKLNLQNVDKRQLQDIKNLKEFAKLNLNNKKLFVAIGNAAIVCTRQSKDFKDIGIDQILTLRVFLANFIFPDTSLNKPRAEECFKWALSRVEPVSPFVAGFDVNSMNYTEETCQENTSIEVLNEAFEELVEKLDIKSCDVEKYEHPTGVGYNVMKMYLFSESVDKNPEYKDELLESLKKFETDLLETQIDCILKDLRET